MHESSHSAWYEPEQQFSFEAFDNFSKDYVSVEDLAVRRVHVDPDRLLFMLDERILIFLKSDGFYPPSVKTQKNGSESIEKRPKFGVKRPRVRRFDHSSSLTVGRLFFFFLNNVKIWSYNDGGSGWGIMISE